MKIKLNEMNASLSDLTSPYYCGSSCLLSLFFIVEAIQDSSAKDFVEAFPHLKENIIKLFDEDTTLFALSKKKEILIDDEWNSVIMTFEDYADIITDLTMLEDLLNGSLKDRYYPLVRRNKDFLILLAKENIKAFDNRSDAPMVFPRVINEVYQASKKENQDESH